MHKLKIANHYYQYTFSLSMMIRSTLPSFPIDAEKVKQAHLANEWFTKFIGLFGSSNLDLQHLDTVCLGSNLEYLQTPANEPVTHDQIQELRARYTAKQSALTQVQAQIVEPTLEPIRVAREQALHIEAEAQWQELHTQLKKRDAWVSTKRFLTVNLQITEVIINYFRFPFF